MHLPTRILSSAEDEALDTRGVVQDPTPDGETSQVAPGTWLPFCNILYGFTQSVDLCLIYKYAWRVGYVFR